MTPSARVAVEAFLTALPDAPSQSWRRLSDDEWGLTVEAAGWPLHVGIALRDGVLLAQAEALAPDRVSDHELLHRNRGLRLVRYAHAGDGTVWVIGDIPPAAVDEQALDRLLGAVVGAAVVARERRSR